MSGGNVRFSEPPRKIKPSTIRTERRGDNQAVARFQVDPAGNRVADREIRQIGQFDGKDAETGTGNHICHPVTVVIQAGTGNKSGQAITRLGQYRTAVFKLLPGDVRT